MTEPVSGVEPAAAPTIPQGKGEPAAKPSKPDRGSLSMDQAVALTLERMRSAEAPTQPPASTAPPPAKANPTDDDGQGAEPEADAVDGEQPATEVEGEQPGDEAQADEEPVKVVLSEHMTLVLPDGREISAADIPGGIMMERDYRKKTAALAERGRALESLEHEYRGRVGELTERLSAAEEAAKAASGERERYSDQVNRILMAQKEHCAQWDRVDWDKLDAENPTYANQLWRKRERDFEALRRIETETAELESKRQADLTARQSKAQEDYTTSWVKARQDLFEYAQKAVPALFDPAKAGDEWGQIERTLKGVGLTDPQIQAAFGARHDFSTPIVSVPIFELIRKAALYDKAVDRVKAGKGSAAGETARLPAADADGKIRVMQANTTRVRVPNAAQAALGRAHATFNRTGTLKDAIAYEMAKRAVQPPPRG